MPTSTIEEGDVIPLSIVPKIGTFAAGILFRNFPAPPGDTVNAYGDAGFTQGQRHPRNPVVIKTERTPATDKGASANSDFKLQRGKRMAADTMKIQNCLVDPIPPAIE